MGKAGAFKATYIDVWRPGVHLGIRTKQAPRCHNPDKACSLCPFCSRSFNRRDNMLDHLYKHTQKRGGKTRVKFYPEAEAVYKDEMRKCSRRRKVEKKPKP
ncbi:hypothetical protein HD806DRAFT_487456 [Xylariaceae sp. AK1471]|nr:hypothetical protein HD806DRAFT_487456 [Xylariaceae sp. AK1471]